MTTTPDAPQSMSFRAYRLGPRPLVTVTPTAITYEQRYANWLTWTLLIFTAGLVLFVWPWVLFGRRSITLPARSIAAVDVTGSSTAVLRVVSTGGTITFRTDLATAEAARNIFMNTL